MACKPAAVIEPSYGATHVQEQPYSNRRQSEQITIGVSTYIRDSQAGKKMLFKPEPFRSTTQQHRTLQTLRGGFFG